MSKVLVVTAHDTMVDSVANKLILEEFAKLAPEAVINDLDALYPDHVYNEEIIKAEQAKLVEADVIVLQFPFYWYSMPGMLHRWMEFVFEHGFSHGRTGKALEGKKLVVSFTTGAPDFAYAKDGVMLHSLEDYMAPFESTCVLTNMKYGGFVATTGVSYSDRKPENAEIIREKCKAHAEKLLELVEKQ